MSLSLSEKYLEFLNTPFPKGWSGRDVAGVCITLLDSEAAGIITTYMEEESNYISLHNLLILQKSSKDLVAILPHLKDHVYDYFSLLHELCRTIELEAEIP